MSAGTETHAIGAEPPLVHALQTGWLRAAQVFTAMFDTDVTLTAPGITRSRDLPPTARATIVAMTFAGPGSQGTGALLLPYTSARSLISSLLDESGAADEEVLALIPATAVEVGNVVLNSLVAEVGRLREEAFCFQVPEVVTERHLVKTLSCGPAAYVLQGGFQVAGAAEACLGILVQLADGERGQRSFHV